MPVVSIPLVDLNQQLGTQLDKEQLEARLEQLGCDIEDFTQIHRIRCNQCNVLQEITLQEELPNKCPDCLQEAEGKTLWESLGYVDVVRMDLLPVRPDIFDSGGLGRAIRGLLKEEMALRHYDVAPAQMEIQVDASTQDPLSYRPHIACAVIRGLKIDDVKLRLLMKLQENLHWALGRDRKLASIGVYDISRVSGNVSYTTVGLEEIRFIPLQPQKEEAVTPKEILEKHPKGIDYAHLLAGFERVPLLMDSQKQVLSMPPIINSNETKLHLGTTDVFIDVTGIVGKTVNKTLHILFTSILELFPKARGEKVRIVFPDQVVETPTLATEHYEVDVAYANRMLGIDVDQARAIELLQQMRHDVKPVLDKAGWLEVTVPCYRNDIMHQVDLIEDLAIAYDYNQIVPSLVPTLTVAKERPERLLAQRVSQLFTGLGYFEVMSLLLSNEEEQYVLMGEEDPKDAVKAENPASSEQGMLRTRITPQLLNLFALNRGQGLPQKLFEVDDVVRLIASQEEPIEELHLAAGLHDSHVGFADVKALAKAVSFELGLEFTYEPSSMPCFIAGRSADIFHHGNKVGWMGEVHPSVLSQLRLTHSLVVLEINLQPFLPSETHT